MSKTLTQRGVDSSQPRERRYGKACGLVPGFRVLVFPSGAKSYALFARVHGELINLKIGNAAVMPLAAARQEARQKLTEIARGLDPRAVKRGAAAIETFGATARRYVERHAKAHTRRWKETERLLEHDAVPRWKHRPIDKISRHDVVALLDRIVDRGAPQAANVLLATLRGLFNWAVARGMLEVSPCGGIKAPGPASERDRVLSDAELELVWRAAEKLDYPAGPFVRLLILSGCRREEVGGMRWSEIDPELTVLSLPAARVKNNTAHKLPISAAMRDILQKVPRLPGDFVLTTTGQFSLRGFSRIKLALDTAIADLNGGTPIAPWTLHDVRRSFASGAAALGIGLEVIEKILNHQGGSFGGVRGIYQRHSFFDEMARALALWGDHVLALVSHQPGRPSRQTMARGEAAAQP
jgi:integrase